MHSNGCVLVADAFSAVFIVYTVTALFKFYFNFYCLRRRQHVELVIVVYSRPAHDVQGLLTSIVSTTSNYYYYYVTVDDRQPDDHCLKPGNHDWLLANASDYVWMETGLDVSS